MKKSFLFLLLGIIIMVLGFITNGPVSFALCFIGGFASGWYLADLIIASLKR